MKTFDFKIDPLTGEEYLEVYLRGQRLLADPLLNKGSHFSEEERITLELQGILPHGTSSVEDQIARTLESYERKQNDLDRYIYLNSLLNRNETLFYRLLTAHLTEMVPIVYTPTVGQACQMLSRIMRDPRGVYIHPDNIGRIDEILQSVPLPRVQLIVVTDGERILGLGDLGADGMGIPVGKVSLYVAAGGLHPACCLPMCLDVGTNNERLLKDPLYLGYRRPRLTGQDYFDFVERFVLGVKRNFPDALVQWEDFAKHTAFTILERYQGRLLSFNDDIQGTGATACAALLTAMRIKGSTFKEQRFVIVGMGQAGTGVAGAIRAILEEEGLSPDEVRRRIFAVDQQGLLIEDDPKLEDPQRPYAQPRAAVAGWTLASPSAVALKDVVRNARPTAIATVTALKGLLDAELLGMMAEADPRPVILPLSNPTSRCECTPEEVFAATKGCGLVATGSPFEPVRWNGRDYATSQCNNLYMFPGIGLGALVARSQRVTPRMFVAASKALSAMVSAEQMGRGLLLPEIEQIREVSARVALATAIEAREAGLGRNLPDDELARLIRGAQWTPRFYPYRAGDPRRVR